jgi:hypothetical protein
LGTFCILFARSRAYHRVFIRKTKGNIVMPKSNKPLNRARTAPSFERHRRKCAVCQHPERETIEDYFIHWFRPGWIASHFELSEDSLDRHIFATGLYAVRSSRVRFALDHIIERVNQAPVTASSVVEAVRAYTRIDDRGRWAEPPTTHIVVPAAGPSAARIISHAAQESKSSPQLPACGEASPEPQNPILGCPVSNRGEEELENAATR